MLLCAQCLCRSISSSTLFSSYALLLQLMAKFYKSTAKSPLHQPSPSVFPLGVTAIYLPVTKPSPVFIEGRTWLISGHGALKGGVVLSALCAGWTIRTPFLKSWICPCSSNNNSYYRYIMYRTLPRLRPRPKLRPPPLLSESSCTG